METCRFWAGKAEQLKYFKCLLIPQEFPSSLPPIAPLNLFNSWMLNSTRLNLKWAPEKVSRTSGCQGIYRQRWVQCPASLCSTTPLSGVNYKDSLTRTDMSVAHTEQKVFVSGEPTEISEDVKGMNWGGGGGSICIHRGCFWRWLKRRKRKNLQHDPWLSCGSESLYTYLSDNITTQQGIKSTNPDPRPEPPDTHSSSSRSFLLFLIIPTFDHEMEHQLNLHFQVLNGTSCYHLFSFNIFLFSITLKTPVCSDKAHKKLLNIFQNVSLYLK